MTKVISSGVSIIIYQIYILAYVGKLPDCVLPALFYQEASTASPQCLDESNGQLEFCVLRLSKVSSYIFSCEYYTQNRVFCQELFMGCQKNILTFTFISYIIHLIEIENYSAFERKFLTSPQYLRIIVILKWKYQSKKWRILCY